MLEIELSLFERAYKGDTSLQFPILGSVSQSHLGHCFSLPLCFKLFSIKTRQDEDTLDYLHHLHAERCQAEKQKHI